MPFPSKKYDNPQKARLAIERFCAFQDRSAKEVDEKLRAMGIEAATREAWVDELIDQKFIDDSRFVRSFVRGKLEVKKWGWIRIERELKGKGISNIEIEDAKAEFFNEEDYIENMRMLALKKWSESPDDPIKAYRRAGSYLYGKGYEMELIKVVLEEMKGE